MITGSGVGVIKLGCVIVDFGCVSPASA